MARRGEFSRNWGMSHSRIAWTGAAACMFASGCANIWNFSELEPGRRYDASTEVSDTGVMDDSTVREEHVDAGPGDGPPTTFRDAAPDGVVVADAAMDSSPPDGGCPAGCPSGTTCDNGSCACQSQPNLCGAQCVDLLTNRDHCGTCTTVCPTGAVCSAGLCKCSPAEPDTCAKTTGDAGAQCVNVLSDHGNCGVCNNACAATSACHVGTCTICGTLLTDRQCDGGVCIDTASDPHNCGACNHQCPTGASCASGTCPCPAGSRVCGANPGACVDVTNGDPTNCGACGHLCSLLHAAASCSVSSCIIFKCNAGFTDCDRVPSNGCEIHTATDPSNCGSCGHACTLPHAVPHCTANICVVSSCDPGYTDCDKLNVNGCETHTDSDVNNCGACGHVCSVPAGATATCVGGVCGCAGALCPCTPPAIRCGAACANTSNDPANCGVCSHACATPTGGSVTCGGGACVGSCSTAGFTACPAVDPTACVSLLTDPNCGACGFNCSLMTGGICVAGTCVPLLFDAGTD